MIARKSEEQRRMETMKLDAQCLGTSGGLVMIEAEGAEVAQ